VIESRERYFFYFGEEKEILKWFGK